MAGRQERMEQCVAAYDAAVRGPSDRDTPKLAKVAFELGYAYCDVGCIRQATMYLERALVAEEGHLSEAPAVYAEAVEALAYIYGMLEEAEKECKTLDFALRLHIMAGNKLARAWIMVLKADFWLKVSDIKQRAVTLRRAGALLEGASGQGAELRKAVHCLLAATPSSKGGSKGSPQEEAVGRYLCRFAMAASADHVSGRQSLGDHVSGRRSLAGELALAAALGGLGTDLTDRKVSELERVQKLLEALVKTHGADHIHTARALMVLADMHGDRDDPKLRMETLKKVLRIQEETFGMDAIYIARTLKGLAQVYSLLGESEKRLDALRRAVELQEEELGSNHGQTTITRFYLQAAQAESRGLVDPEGGRELAGLFGRRPPTNGKVNRYVGECTFPEGWDAELPNRALEPFVAECTGGGSCAARDGGIDVPFYYTPLAPVA